MITFHCLRGHLPESGAVETTRAPFPGDEFTSRWSGSVQIRHHDQRFHRSVSRWLRWMELKSRRDVGLGSKQTRRRQAMGRGLLLWLIGIPIPIILLIWLFGGLS